MHGLSWMGGKEIAMEDKRVKIAAIGAAGLAALFVIVGGAWFYFARSGADLMQAGPLGEQALGDPRAPVTIIEYASMSCPHCARFATEAFPKLDERYIKTGKVRFIFREFPLNTHALAAAALARCAQKENYFIVVDTLFRRQAEWLAENPVPSLLGISKAVG